MESFYNFYHLFTTPEQNVALYMLLHIPLSMGIYLFNQHIHKALGLISSISIIAYLLFSLPFTTGLLVYVSIVGILTALNLVSPIRTETISGFAPYLASVIFAYLILLLIIFPFFSIVG